MKTSSAVVFGSTEEYQLHRIATHRQIEGSTQVAPSYSFATAFRGGSETGRDVFQQGREAAGNKDALLDARLSVDALYSMEGSLVQQGGFVEWRESRSYLSRSTSRFERLI